MAFELVTRSRMTLVDGGQCVIPGCRMSIFGGTRFCEKHSIEWAHSSEFRRAQAIIADAKNPVGVMGAVIWNNAEARTRAALNDFVIRTDREKNSLTWDERARFVQKERVEETLVSEAEARITLLQRKA